ncbi:MAG: hypothetical protein J6N19_03010 [Clostridium sp.]|nr:hypothetical protein [Clostridium sp.]
MKLMKRNLTKFLYHEYLGEDERYRDDRRTGTMAVRYAYPVELTGNISVPSMYANNEWFGIDTNYTHILVMSLPTKVEIKEEGMIEWRNNKYDIKAVRPSLNVLAVALRQRTENRVNA